MLQQRNGVSDLFIRSINSIGANGQSVEGFGGSATSHGDFDRAISVGWNDLQSLLEEVEDFILCENRRPVTLGVNEGLTALAKVERPRRRLHILGMECQRIGEALDNESDVWLEADEVLPREGGSFFWLNSF